MTALALGHRPRAARASRRSSCRPPYLPPCWPPTSGWRCTRAPASHLFPALGAYVGGDIVAGMLASGMDRDKRTRLFIDVGTNCEIVLSDGDRILATAAPAGPAFEGGAIRCGMRADDGAIEVVKLDPADGGGVELGRDRRRRAEGAVRLRAGRRGGRAGAGRAARRAAAASSPTRRAPRSRPGLADRLTMIGKERVFVLHRPTAGRRPGRLRGADPARRPRAPVRQGRDLHRLDAAARGARPRAPRRPAGAAGRLVRQLPLRRLRRADRPGAEAAGAAHRRGRQRRRRGREDGAALAPRARRRAGAARGGDLCRALRPPRVQRQVRRPARASATERRSHRRWSPAARSPSPRPRSSRGAAGRSTYTRCRRCCTTSRS